jgi:hypothetical protein
LNKFTIAIIILFLHLDIFLFSQVKEPEKPYIAKVKDDIDFQSFNYRARILIQGRTAPAEMNIILNSDILIFADNKKVKVRDISRINVLLWEKRSRLNKHTFYPSRYEVFYSDYKKEILNGNVESLNKIRTADKKSGYIYLYYYDYYRNGKWTNSGVSDFDGLVSKPAEGCAVSIELIQ